MTRTATEAAGQLLDALKTLDGWVATRDPGKSLTTFPTAVIGPPTLAFGNMNYSGATDATFSVHVVVAADAQTLAKVEAAVIQAVEAIWTVDDAVTTNAVPSTYPSGTTELPAYELTVEVSL